EGWRGGGGGCGGGEEGVWGGGKIKFSGRFEPKPAENTGHRQRRHFGRHQCAGEMDQRADRAMVVREVFTAGWTGRRSEVVGRWRRAGERARARWKRRDALEMHVAERNRELERQRKKRQIRPQSRTRPEQTHCRCASRLMPRQNHSAGAFENFSNNVTLPQLGRVAVQSRFIWPVAKSHHSSAAGGESECRSNSFSFRVVAPGRSELGKHPSAASRQYSDYFLTTAIDYVPRSC